MVNGKTFRAALDKFFKSPVCQDARVQVELPNGEMYDLVGVDLMENKIELSIRVRFRMDRRNNNTTAPKPRTSLAGLPRTQIADDLP